MGTIKTKTVARNKKATHLYFIEDTFEAGVVLRGTEIKSIRAGKVSIQDSYIRVKDQEAFIINLHIAKFKQGAFFNHEETRERKLLLHKREIIRLETKTKKEGATLIPLSIYFKEGLCKIEIALAKGKKQYDKRQSLKEKDQKRRMEKTLANRNR